MYAVELYSNSFIPVVIPENNETPPIIRAKIQESYNIMSVIVNVPIPIPVGGKRSYSIKFKSRNPIKITGWEGLKSRLVDKDSFEIEGRCNVENIQKGDKIVLSLNSCAKSDLITIADYKSNDIFKFQLYKFTTNCYYLDQSNLYVAVKVFNDDRAEVENYSYKYGYLVKIPLTGLCSDYLKKKEEGICVDPNAKNYGELSGCDFKDRKNVFCDDRWNLNYGKELPCADISRNYYGERVKRDVLVCDRR